MNKYFFYVIWYLIYTLSLFLVLCHYQETTYQIGSLYKGDLYRHIFLYGKPNFLSMYYPARKCICLVRIKLKFIRIAYLYSKCTDCRINHFILQSVHLLYKYAIRIHFCFIRTRRINFCTIRINFSAYE
jgi:hypothetical protein